jgi:hypothetical protein
MIAGDRLDTIYHIATPEGCAIDLRVAGPVARARAWFLDFLVRLRGVWPGADAGQTILWSRCSP